ncbi:MAG TPA: DUF1153 domain-containing protein [Stellaceae bacterium]|jgi:hypothetical protein
MSDTKSIGAGAEGGEGALPLPPANTARWSPRRKAAVVAATRTGVISRGEACERYLLSPEELASWEAALDENGIPGLRTTRQQIYRATVLGKTRQQRRRS